MARVSTPQPAAGGAPDSGPVPVVIPSPGAWRRLRGVMGWVRRTLRQASERWLHPFRRGRAQTRLATMPLPERVLVLCYGNICRSPYAAAVLTRSLRECGLSTEVQQGGFFGPDRPAATTAKAVAARRGIELRGHRSRLITAELVSGDCLVIVMEPWQARRAITKFGASAPRTLVLGDLDTQPVLERSISDPYGRNADAFEITYDRIDRCVAELVAIMEKREIGLNPTRSPE